MTDNKRKLWIFKIANSCLLIVIVLAALAVAIKAKDDWISPRVDYTIDLDDGWTKILPDGSYEQISGNFSIGNNEPVTFFHKLPEIVGEDRILRIKCPYHTVDAYIDGELIYHAGPAKIGHITTTVGNVFALIPLSPEYSGKDIYLTVEPRHYRYEAIVKDAAITNMSAYALKRIYEFIPYGLLCIALTAISLLALLLYIVFKIIFQKKEEQISRGLMELGLFGLCVVIWILSDFHIAGMLTGRMVFSGLINYVSFLLCLIFFSGILFRIFSKSVYFKMMLMLSEINFVVQMVLFFAGIMDLPNGFLFSHGLVALAISGMLYFGMVSVNNLSVKNVILLGTPMICFMILAIVASVSYLMNGEWMFYVALAMMFYAVTVVVYMIINLWNALKQNLELQHIKKIAYLDNMTGLENRRAYSDCIEYLNERIEKDEADSLLSVVMLDVNGLKKTNDIFGHAAGDELITGSAECIKKVFGDIGRCFRTGGDEFVVIATMEHSTFVEKIDELVKDLSEWKGEYIDGISISVGKADRKEYPDNTVDMLLNIADMRMYENKQDYYTSQLMAEDVDTYIAADTKSARRMRYVDRFDLNKYTMPIIRQIAGVIPGGFFIYREDEKRELIYQNRKVLDIYGCNTLDEFKELTGYTFEGMVYPADFKTIQDSIDRQIDDSEGDSMDHVIYRITRKDGQIRWVDDYGHFSHSKDYGDIYYVFISDITDVRQQEEN
ncbi:MAG: diguanylate cyclase [Lachnospiraceae bacterium]|nr:diguanylate cyclase [Lachnospiraceae bacterium]